MHWQVRIEELEAEVQSLRVQVQDSNALKAQVSAKDMALKAKLGNEATDIQALPPVAWGLLWQEYFDRQGLFQFVSLEGRRSKNDKYGNKWNLYTLRDFTGFEDVKEALDISEVDDVIILHCIPNTGAYDIAKEDIDKHQEKHREAQKQIYILKEAIKASRSPEKAQNLQREIDIQQEVADRSAKGYHECKAIIENAVQRYYSVPMKSLENMDMYGLDIHCKTATITAQKKFQNLPTFAQVEQAVPSAIGEW